MNSATLASRPATPWHLWAVGIVSLLWNSIGITDYTLTQLRYQPYLDTMGPDLGPKMMAFLEAAPVWMDAAWAFGVWGAFVGSVLLLLRNRLAVPAFALSLAGAAVTTVHNYLLADPSALEISGSGGLYFAIVILAIAAFLLWYAMRAKRMGLLG